MDFSCSCDVGVDDFSEMIEEKVKKANKEHTCHECGANIERGEKYLFEKEIYDGRISTHKTCLPCKEIRNAYLSAYYWGQIWQDLRECFDDIPLADFDKLSPKAQQKILEML